MNALSPDSAGVHAAVPAIPRHYGRWWNPLSLLFGPIFVKEMLASGRRRTTFAIRTVFLLVLGTVLLLSLSGTADRAAGSAAEAQRLSSLASDFAAAVGWITFVGLSLLAAIMTAGAIPEERSARTMASLFSTPLTAGQMVFGKLAARIAQLVLLALATIPALLFLRLLGGVELTHILAFAAATFSTVFFTASVALFLSMWTPRVASAAVLASIVSLAVQLGPAFVLSILQARAGGPPAGLAYTVYASPALSVVAATNPSEFRMLGVDGGVAWAVASSLVGGMGMLVATLAAATLRRVALAEPRKARRGARRQRHPARILSPSAEQQHGAANAAAAPTVTRRGSREVWDNPVLWRELRRPLAASKLVLGLFIAIGAGFVALVYWRTTMRDQDMHYLVAYAGAVLQYLIAATITPSAVASERERRTWEVLLSTPIPARRIIFAKFLGHIPRLLVIPGLLGLHFAAAAAQRVMPPISLAHIVLVLLAWSLATAATGIMFSVAVRSTLSAMLCNIGLWAAAWVGLPLVLAAVLAPWDAPILNRAVLLLNPFYLLGQAISGGWEFGGGNPAYVRDASSELYTLVGRRWSTNAFSLLLLLSIGVAAAFAAAAMWAAVRLVPRTLRKAG
ncbi:MAG: ABC transporter permease subunit [Phycisphaerales bacterium]|nr:ABC transporter permease subunit [Phycisphaerales bacterium]